MFQVFLEQKADLGFIDGDKNTPLHFTAFAGNVEITKLLLLDKRTNINAQNKDGHTPLHIATKEGNVEIMELLLQQKDIHKSTKIKVANDRLIWRRVRKSKNCSNKGPHCYRL